jgi:cob(I)alamin adenosyltransferase
LKIYTRTGDDGTTGLLGGARLRKGAPRIEAYGTVDELNATIGLARAAGLPADLDGALARVQAELFVLGAELATAPGTGRAQGTVEIGEEHARSLEVEIDGWETELEPLRNFILPGGSGAAASLHLARTVCRRAERALVALAAVEPVRRDAVVYLNRLSDHLFVAARVANHRAGVADVPWRGPR